MMTWLASVNKTSLVNLALNRFLTLSSVSYPQNFRRSKESSRNPFSFSSFSNAATSSLNRPLSFFCNTAFIPSLFVCIVVIFSILDDSEYCRDKGISDFKPVFPRSCDNRLKYLNLLILLGLISPVRTRTCHRYPEIGIDVSDTASCCFYILRIGKRRSVPWEKDQKSLQLIVVLNKILIQQQIGCMIS